MAITTAEVNMPILCTGFAAEASSILTEKISWGTDLIASSGDWDLDGPLSGATPGGDELDANYDASSPGKWNGTCWGRRNEHL